MRMRADKDHKAFAELQQDSYWQQVAAEIAGLENAPELDLDDDAVQS